MTAMGKSWRFFCMAGCAGYLGAGAGNGIFNSSYWRGAVHLRVVMTGVARVLVLEKNISPGGQGEWSCTAAVTLAAACLAEL